MTKLTYPNFSIVIPNYNGEKFIAPCLEHLKTAISNCPSSKFEVIFVDNGSQDNSVTIFKKYFRSKAIILPKNLGFSPAVNIGIKASKYEHVCILNNDLNLCNNWFKLISNTITTNPEASTYCGTVLNKDGSLIESQGFQYFMSGRCENINNGRSFSKINNSKLKVSPIWGSSAAVVVYKKKDIIKVGLFDESFFAYIEDVDLSFRLHRQKYKSLLVPSALSYHLGGTTSNKMGSLRQYYTFRNWFKLINKNYTIKEIFQNFPSIIIERLRNLSYLLKSIIYAR